MGWLLKRLEAYNPPSPEEEAELIRKVVEGREALKRVALELGLSEGEVRGALLRELDAKGEESSPLRGLAKERGREVWRAWEEAKAGLLAQREMVERNLRFAVHVAKEARRKGEALGVPMEDLVGAGCLGLAVGTERYDPKKGSFASYVYWWVKRYAFEALQEARAVRLPAHVHEALNRASQASRALEGELGRTPTAEEVAKRLGEGWTEERVEDLWRLTIPPLSLDGPPSEGESEESAPEEWLPSPLPSPEDWALEKWTREKIREAMEGLPPRERRVLEGYFGLDGEEKNFRVLGEEMGVTPERARQLGARALRRMREELEGIGLDL